MARIKTKATYHTGRKTKAGKVFNANHNTQTKTRDGQNHIDHDRTKNNLLYRVENNKVILCRSYDAIVFEKKRYKELFGASLEARNERYRKQRHQERCRTINDLYSDPKKCPFEMVLQIGKAGDGISDREKAELSKKINLEFISELHKRYGRNFVPLDISGHYDETSIHWHYRAVFVFQGKDGLEPNQTKALEKMGIERPDINNPVGKRNNALMTFTAETRELYYQICERHGLEIDREVKNPSQKHKETLEYKCELLEQEVQEKDQMLEQMTAQIHALNAEKELNQREANKEAERYKTNKIQADKEEIRAIHNSELAEKLFTQKVKHNKDGTINIGLKQYQQATALVNETKKILESEVYSPAELKQMRLATEALQTEKARYKKATDNIEEQIERRAEEKAQLQAMNQIHKIEKLENELAQERNDKNYIIEMIKRFLPENVLERFERFSGMVLHAQERQRHHSR